MIDASASQPQYVAHIAPVWHALPAHLRGTFAASGPAARRAEGLGIRPGMLHRDREAVAPLTIVASFIDEQYVRPRPVVLIEHGAGQSYGHDPEGAANPSYPGGHSRDAVVLFVCPNESVAGRWRDMYPSAAIAVVGCPYLDPWHVGWAPEPTPENLYASPLVVFSFHWDCQVVPECRNAFAHYVDELRRLAKLSDEERGWRMGGHAHPRAHEIMAFWRSIGVPTFQHFEEVLDQANLYVCDNSSTIFEFASTDRPVVLLNAPWYRRDVEHGLRFWEAADVGHQVDEPDDVLPAIRDALLDPDPETRRRIVQQVYAYTDGRASERAAEAIVAEYEAGYWRAWRERRVAHDPFAGVGQPTLDGLRADLVRELRAQGRPLDEALAASVAAASFGEMEAVLDEVRGHAHARVRKGDGHGGEA